VAFGINSNSLAVFLKEIRPDDIKHGNTMPKGYFFTTGSFLMDLHRIITAPVTEIVSI
jgi:hypothetical protein